MTTDGIVKLGLIQHACPAGASKAQNLEVSMNMIRDAARRGAAVVATQELFSYPYFPRTEDEANFDLAEPVPGPTTRALGELADELDIEILASLFEKRATGVYHNTSVMIAPAKSFRGTAESASRGVSGGVSGGGGPSGGRIVGTYRKMHIPQDPGFHEKFYFTPGDLGFCAQRMRRGVAGMLICWDQWFPEAARLVALRGAEILFYPAAIGWIRGESSDEHHQQIEAWKIVQRSHAIANGVFVAAINRVGTEGDIRFWGSSFVCEPSGRILAEAPADQDQVLVVDCDLGRMEAWRRGWPFLRDRRVDAYGGLTERVLDGPSAD